MHDVGWFRQVGWCVQIVGRGGEVCLVGRIFFAWGVKSRVIECD